MSEMLSLSDVFLTSTSVPTGWARSPDLDDALRGLWEAGRSRWPDLALSADVFVAHLAERVTEEDAARGPGPCCRALNGADLYLACACLSGIEGAMEAFERECVARVPALVAHMNQSPSFIEELQQDLRVKLLVGSEEAGPRIGQYTGRGTLSGWFSSVTIRTALNRLRDGRATDVPADDDRAAAALLSSDDPEASMLKQRYGAAFSAALRDAFASLPAEQRNLLQLYHAERLTTIQIAAMFQSHHTTVVRRLASARAAVLNEVRRLLRERLQVKTGEFSSIVRLVLSQIDMSFSTMLRGPGGPGR